MHCSVIGEWQNSCLGVLSNSKDRVEVKIGDHRIPEQSFLMPQGRGTQKAEEESPERLRKGLKCEEFHRSQGGGGRRMEMTGTAGLRMLS